jgi:hypothetical protein
MSIASILILDLILGWSQPEIKDQLPSVRIELVYSRDTDMILLILGEPSYRLEDYSEWHLDDCIVSIRNMEGKRWIYFDKIADTGM